MNQNDRDFLHGMMLERMTQHYAAAFPRDKERAQRSSEMENKLTHALTLLPEEQADDVHQYLEYLEYFALTLPSARTFPATLSEKTCHSVGQPCHP